jgi:hypothetical protein
MVLIYNSVHFAKKLHKLKKAGGKAEDAANQAWEIIAEVAAREGLPAQVRSKLTPRGEARIEGCGKFDLGGGYRLLCLKKNGHVVFLFVGAHDECDTWVMNNRDIDPDLDQAEVIKCPENRAIPEGKEVPADSSEASDVERPLHEVIDQQTLREIFSGLCQRAR